MSDFKHDFGFFTIEDFLCSSHNVKLVSTDLTFLGDYKGNDCQLILTMDGKDGYQTCYEARLQIRKDDDSGWNSDHHFYTNLNTENTRIFIDKKVDIDLYTSKSFRKDIGKFVEKIHLRGFLDV
jgi:hypothetical protein